MLVKLCQSDDQASLAAGDLASKLLEDAAIYFYTLADLLLQCALLALLGTLLQAWPAC